MSNHLLNTCYMLETLLGVLSNLRNTIKNSATKTGILRLSKVK